MTLPGCRSELCDRCHAGPSANLSASPGDRQFFAATVAGIRIFNRCSQPYADVVDDREDGLQPSGASSPARPMSQQ